MSKYDQPKRSYGADDLPKCPACGGAMSLIRRTPDSEHGAGWERQTFVCRECRHEIERSVDSTGNPRA